MLKYFNHAIFPVHFAGQGIALVILMIVAWIRSAQLFVFFIMANTHQFIDSLTFYKKHQAMENNNDQKTNLEPDDRANENQEQPVQELPKETAGERFLRQSRETPYTNDRVGQVFVTFSSRSSKGTKSSKE